MTQVVAWNKGTTVVVSVLLFSLWWLQGTPPPRVLTVAGPKRQDNLGDITMLSPTPQAPVVTGMDSIEMKPNKRKVQEDAGVSSFDHNNKEKEVESKAENYSTSENSKLVRGSGEERNAVKKEKKLQPPAPSEVVVSNSTSPFFPNLRAGIGSACVSRPLTRTIQCACLYHCIAREGFYLTRFYLTTNERTKSSRGPEVRTSGMFRPVLLAVSKDWSEPGVMVDIGANDGSDDDEFWEDLDGVARHYFLFEPQQKYVRVLKGKIVDLEKKFPKTKGHLMHGGVGTPDEHGKDHYIIGDGVGAQLLGEDDPRVKGKTSTLPSVRMFNLEKTLEEKGLGNAPIAFLKVDAEGADGTILHANLALFKSKRVQIGYMELNSYYVSSFPIQFPQIISEIRSCGYRIFMLGITGTRSSLVEMRAGFEDYWEYWLDSLVFVSNSSGIMESDQLLAGGNVRPTKEMKQKILRRWTQKTRGSRTVRVYEGSGDCGIVVPRQSSSLKSHDMADYCIPEFIASKQWGTPAQFNMKRSSNMF